MSLRVINPFDGSTVGEVPFDGPGEIDAKIEAARATQAQWRTVPLDDRCRIVRAGETGRWLGIILPVILLITIPFIALRPWG